VTSADLERLADLRAAEAQTLLDAGRWEGAYYLAGYAVECALKSVIARQTRAGEFPDLKRVKDSYTHNLNKLLRLASLRQALEAQPAGRQVNWKTVAEWSEQSRYLPHMEEQVARDLVEAVTSETDGILSWLLTR
jgi:HEPN domain-containing protein